MRTITDLVRPGVRRQREQADIASSCDSRGSRRQAWMRWGWFVALWCAGVAGTVVLALPFKLIIATAK